MVLYRCSASKKQLMRGQNAVETERPASSTIFTHDALYDRLHSTGSLMLVVSPLRKALAYGMSCVAEIGNGPLLALRYRSTGGWSGCYSKDGNTHQCGLTM